MVSFLTMKSFRLMIVIAVSLLVIGSASVQAQSKIASVDMKKLFNSYYKTKLAEDLLDKDKADARKNLKDQADGIQQAEADYKQLLDQANDQAISSDARDKLKQSAADKEQEIESSKAEFEKFQRQVEATVADKSQRMSENLIEEIQKAVSDKAKLGGYTVVVNSANPEAVVYVSAETDITGSVLAQLNAGAPIDVSAPASGSLFNASTNSQ
jgi:Skp family chaperone for outer membrane proteins